MRSTNLSRTRRWIGASALAVIIGVGGISAYAGTTQQATAQVQKAAQIQVPPVAAPAAGFADLVDAVKPAVVSILVEAHSQDSTNTMDQGGNQYNFQLPDLPDDHPLKKFFDQFGKQGGANPGKPQPPQMRKYQAAGSGFAITADGYFVTNNHVVQDADKITVVFDNGTQKTAKVIGTDSRTDLAVIKVDGLTDQPFVKLSTADPRVGDWVMAVGNPFGLGGTVTVGVVSAKGRDIGGSSYGDFLQIDAAVNSGNSGGPTFNLNGDVVGVNTAIFSPNGGSVGIAFAIPAATVKQITDSLIKNGSVTRGFLGVSIQDVSQDIANSVGLKNTHGALVTEPTKGSPADRAGVKSGDVITAVDGKTIDNALALSREIAGKTPGSKVTLDVWRNNASQKIDVTLDTLDQKSAQATPDKQTPAPQPAAPTPSSVGVTLVPNSDPAGGLLIQDIDPNSVAASKGFAVGDAVLEVDNKPVKTADEFEQAIKAVKDSGRTTALIKANRGGAVRFIGLPLTDTTSK
jgi:serine protease Do